VIEAALQILVDGRLGAADSFRDELDREVVVPAFEQRRQRAPRDSRH